MGIVVVVIAVCVVAITFLALEAVTIEDLVRGWGLVEDSRWSMTKLSKGRGVVATLGVCIGKFIGSIAMSVGLGLDLDEGLGPGVQV